MRNYICTLFLLSCVSLMTSCEEGTPTQEQPNNLSVTETTTTCFTANLKGNIENHTPRELSLGESGVIYCEESCYSESLIESWKNGEKSTSLIEGKGKISKKTECEVSIEGLKPSTHYKGCLYFKSENREVKEISDPIIFTTEDFNPNPIINVTCIDILYSSFNGNIQIKETDIPFCTTTISLSLAGNNGSNAKTEIVINNKTLSNCGDFEAEKDLMQPDTDYQAFVHVTNKVTSDTIYSETISFRTLSPNIMLVDLGLPSGIMWADRNLGTKIKKRQYEYDEIGKRRGYLYKWAELKPSDYNDTYSLTHKDGKYLNVGNDISGTEYDVVHVTLGGKWRMPRTKDVEELISHAKYSATPTIRTIGAQQSGYLILSNPDDKTKNIIFVSQSFFWTSDINSEEPSSAYVFGYDGDEDNIYMNSPLLFMDRTLNRSIRPIWDPNME